jgi:predicted ferric reductase
VAGLWRILVYLAIVFAPLSVAAIFHFPSKDNLLANIGRCLALLAFGLLIMQVALAARLKWTERPFGLNLMFPFHRRMGVFITCILIAHPLVMAASGDGWPLLIGLKQPWNIWIAKAALLLLLVNTIISVYRVPLGLKFESWRMLHDLLGPTSILLLVFLHSWFTGTDLSAPSMRVLWVVLLVGAVLLFGYHRLLRPWWLGRHPYRVTDVRQETPDVWTLRFAPPPEKPRFDFLPGQFQFVTLRRGRGLPVEEHHFTISSSPTDSTSHTSTIKASGDFTATIGKTQPGDLAVIQAPFGRFSYVLHPEVEDLVFISGGIGITPLMSNLRHMRDTRAEKRVLLLYSSRTEDGIVFREELEEIAAGVTPELEVRYILTQAHALWEGEQGRLHREMIKRLCGARLTQSTFFFCCPPPMLADMLAILQDLGVPARRISYEYFSL